MIECSRDPFSFLCEDAWLEIFKYLHSDPHDLINLGATCTQFQNLLETYKLFGLSSSLGACYLQAAAPLLHKYFTLKEMLRLRLISKRVSRTVTKQFNENPRITDDENLNLYPRLIPPRPSNSYEWDNFKMRFDLVVMIESLAAIDRLDSRLGGATRLLGGGDPVLGKWLHFVKPDNPEQDQLINLRRMLAQRRARVLGENEIEEQAPAQDPVIVVPHNVLQEQIQAAVLQERHFFSRLLQVFSSFPEDFKYIRVDSYGSSFSYREFYDVLQKIIHALPTLCHLLIDFDKLFPAQPDQVILFVPLPPSPKLEEIMIRCYKVPEALLRQFSSVYGSHLKMLHMDFIDDQTFMEMEHKQLGPEESEDRGQSYDFLALQELSVFKMLPQTLTGLGRINAPQLKSLLLEDWVAHGVESVDDLITIILKFPSITYFNLDVTPNILEDPHLAMQALNGNYERHRNLTTLRLRGPVFTSNIPLRFFTLVCPNLRFISMYIDIWDRVVSRDHDFNLLRERRLHESRIWEDAPNLEQVKLADLGNPDNQLLRYVCRRPA